MQRSIVVLFSLLTVGSPATGAERLKFWNLTGFTITELHLAPAGTTDWGPNQCKNDPDGAVDSDERLTLKNVVPGHYDVKLVDQQGRSCLVQNVTLCLFTLREGPDRLQSVNVSRTTNGSFGAWAGLPVDRGDRRLSAR